MNKTYLMALAAALVAAPAALAHEPAGTSRNYCEDPSEWFSHDYGPPGTGHVIFLGQDGNLVGDCNGDTVPADYDGHIEFAHGGGWLSANSGDGVTGGSIVCFGEVAHHPFFGPISVQDAVFGGTLVFWVAADTVNNIPPTDPAEPNCGDFESDEGAGCTNACHVTFEPGLDGTYQVYVGEAETGSIGVAGHIETGVVPLPACATLADDDGDGDGGTFGTDLGCTTPWDDNEKNECSEYTTPYDNDGDGSSEWFPLIGDPNCAHPLDESESPPPPPPTA